MTVGHKKIGFITKSKKNKVKRYQNKSEDEKKKKEESLRQGKLGEGE